jgi:hypothetical protein
LLSVFGTDGAGDEYHGIVRQVGYHESGREDLVAIDGQFGVRWYPHGAVRFHPRERRAEPFYTPAAGDADQYNEHGHPRGDAGPGSAPARLGRLPQVSGRWAGASSAEQARLLEKAHGEALDMDAYDPRTIAARIAKLTVSELLQVKAKLDELAARERETVWCEAHGGGANPHFKRDDCVYPHLTDQWTRARMNAAARK